MESIPFNPFAMQRKAMIAGLVGGVAGAYFWKSHRVIGFLLGSIAASAIASVYLVNDAASGIVKQAASSGTPVTAATLADLTNDEGYRTSNPFSDLKAI